MADLENLRWLVWYLNIVGLLPFRMEINRKTKRFERFAFSYCHVVTWWFAFLVVVEVASVGTLGTLGSSFSQGLKSQNKFTYFSMTLQTISFLTFIISPRIILFYHKNFIEAATCIKKVDEIIRPTGHWPCTSKRRTLVGMFLMVLLITDFVVVDSSAYETFYQLKITFLAYLITFFTFRTLCINSSIYLFFHLGFYTIAHRLEILTCLLARKRLASGQRVAVIDVEEQNPWNTKSLGDQLRTLKYLYYCLSRSADNFGALFSLVIWLAVSVKIVTLVTSLFLFTSSIIDQKPVQQLSGSYATSMVIELIQLAILFISADMPVKRVKRLQQELMSISNQPMSDSDKLELASFQNQVSEDHFRLVAGGQFQVGMHLVPSLTGTVLTYLIILLQSGLDSAVD